MNPVTDDEYNTFIDTGKVKKERIINLALKIINRVDLDLRERAIFFSKTELINKLIKKYNYV